MIPFQGKHCKENLLIIYASNDNCQGNWLSVGKRGFNRELSGQAKQKSKLLFDISMYNVQVINK